MSGNLDHTALHRALNQVVARHEALRTHFAERDGVPYQAIGAQPLVDLPLTDLAELTEPTRTTTVSRILDEELPQPSICTPDRCCTPACSASR